MKIDNCDTCQAQLFSLVDNSMTVDIRQQVDLHLEGCEDCSQALSDIWQMEQAASRWQDQQPAHWNKQAYFFGNSNSGWFNVFGFSSGGLQLATTLASVAVLVLVMTEARISTTDGFTIDFSPQQNYVAQAELDSRLRTIQDAQTAMMDTSVARLTDQQIATNQLLLRSVLDTSRAERRQDLQSLVVLLEETQAERSVSTEESLRYLIASQLRDREEIKELNDALLQVDTGRNF